MVDGMPGGQHMGRELSALVEPLLQWYDAHARVLPWREEPTPYRVWLSEVMLQQTRVEAVKPYFDRFISAVPSIEALAELPEERLLKLWEGLGYYNRARHLKQAAQQVAQRFGGCLPASFGGLLSLPGIGAYTAGAIASIAYGLPVPAVDGNVLRVLARVLAYDGDIANAAVKNYFRDLLAEVLPIRRAGDFNQALMELGAMVCVPNGLPHCDACPWQRDCRAWAEGTVTLFPVKKAPKQRKMENKTVLLLHWQGKIAVNKRAPQGLLAGMWEFPNLPGFYQRAEIEKALADWGIVTDTIKPGKKARHIFTHIEWLMQSYHIFCSTDQLPSGWIWADEPTLRETISLPTAFRQFYQELFTQTGESSVKG